MKNEHLGRFEMPSIATPGGSHSSWIFLCAGKESPLPGKTTRHCCSIRAGRETSSRPNARRSAHGFSMHSLPLKSQNRNADKRNGRKAFAIRRQMMRRRDERRPRFPSKR